MHLESKRTGFNLAPIKCAAVATCWRAGATATLDRLNKYFTFSEMPVVSSNYWNMKLNGEDSYGEEILKTLGKNMVKELQYRRE
jgi:hypothetical protein